MEPKRCTQCNRLLGQLEPLRAEAATAEKGKVIFHVKCPRCGKINHIDLSYDKDN